MYHLTRIQKLKDENQIYHVASKHLQCKEGEISNYVIENYDLEVKLFEKLLPSIGRSTILDEYNMNDQNVCVAVQFNLQNIHKYININCSNTYVVEKV